jgi:hypothetical protein
MEARRSKNFKEFYKSTGEHSVNIREHVKLTLLGLYPGWTNQLVLTLPPSIFGIIPPKKIQETNACSQALHQN